jgi:hypothetical protein
MQRLNELIVLSEPPKPTFHSRSSPKRRAGDVPVGYSMELMQAPDQSCEERDSRLVRSRRACE